MLATIIIVSFGNNNNERIIPTLAQAHLGFVKKQANSPAVWQTGVLQ